MAGTRLEELQAKAARLKELQDKALALSQRSQPEPSTADQLRQVATNLAPLQQDINQRIQNVQQTIASPHPAQPVADVALAIPGQTAGAVFDTLGRVVTGGAKMFAEEFPNATQAITGAAKSIADFEKEHLNLSGVISEGVEALKQKDPKGFRQLENVGNVALLATPKAPSTPKRGFGSQLAASGRKARARNAKEYITEVIADPRLDIENALIKKGKLKFDFDKSKKLDAAAVSRIKGISPKKDIITNRNVIKAENRKVISELDQILNSANDIRINLRGIDNLIDSKMSSAIERHFLLDEPATLSIRRLGDAMKQAIRSNPNTPAGLWAARKQFDAAVKANRPNVFSDSMRPYNFVAGEVRRTINDLIDAAMPDAGIKSRLRKSHHYFNALNDSKAEAVRYARELLRSQRGKQSVGKLMESAVRAAISPGGRFTTGATATATAALSGSPKIALALGGLTAALTVGKIAKDIAKAPITRELIGEGIQLLDRALSASNLSKSALQKMRIDRAALVEIYESFEDENGN